MKLADKNRLSITHPELCKEWDYEGNGALKPEDVSFGSHKMVRWICKNGHKTEETINNRTHTSMSYSSCKNCCSLAFNYPNVVSEWHPTKNESLTPWNVTYGSKIRIWLMCKNGHEWSCLASEWALGNYSCPTCRSFGFKNPELVAEWHPTKNEKTTIYMVAAHCNDKKWWVCPICDSEYESSPSNRSKGRGCPYCSNQKLCKNNCLAVKNPYLASEWHPTKNGKLTPYLIIDGGTQKVYWLCPTCKRDYSLSILSRKNGANCPYCSFPPRKLCIDNCLMTKNPLLAKEWNYEKNGKLTPYDVFSCMDKKVYWICKNRHVWLATIAGRSRGNGCPYCNKIELKDGTICDSLTEAYLYLRLKDGGVVFLHNQKYGAKLGSCRYDFYIPPSNTYVEVTAFFKNSTFVDGGTVGWYKYLRKIVKKKRYVQSIGANFKFIQLKLNKEQRSYVQQNRK